MLEDFLAQIVGRIGRGISKRISGEIPVGAPESISHEISGETTKLIPEEKSEMKFLKNQLHSLVTDNEGFSGACTILHQNSLQARQRKRRLG